METTQRIEFHRKWVRYQEDTVTKDVTREWILTICQVLAKK